MRVGTWTRRVAAVVLTFAPLSLTQPTAHAQSPAEFYKGRNVELYIGYSVGGAYDLSIPAATMSRSPWNGAR